MGNGTSKPGALLLSMFRREIWALAGILGLALNLIGSLGPLLTLAEFAKYLVEHWLDLTAFVWVYVFRLVHIEIPALLGFALTLFLFHAGLTVGSLRAASAAEDEAATTSRDRLIAILLYLPLLIATLSTSFNRLSQDLVQSEQASNDSFVIAALFIVLASPVMVFVFARPRQLIRRFIAVYCVAAFILLLDMAARYLERAVSSPRSL